VVGRGSCSQRVVGGDPNPAPPTGEPSEQDRSGPASKADGGSSEGQGERVEQDLDALLGDVQRERDEYLDLAKRTKADFENYRKRMAAEVTAANARGKAALVGELIHAIDNLERALGAAEIDPEAEEAPEEPLAQGILLTYRELCAALTRAGVEPLEAAGEKFDPNLHEALSTRAADGAESGTVVDVMQKGYRLGEQLIRPARVVVAE
jgi:molecular chaperone GrpE